MDDSTKTAEINYEWTPSQREYPEYLNESTSESDASTKISEGVSDQQSSMAGGSSSSTNEPLASAPTNTTAEQKKVVEGIANISDALNKVDLMKEAQRIGRENVFADSTYFYILHEEIHKPFDGVLPKDVADKAWNGAMNIMYTKLKEKGIEMNGEVKGNIVHQMTRYDRTDFLIKIRKDTVL